MGCLKARPKVYIRSKYMADKEKRGLVARWLLGKERSEDYARSTLPTSRWALFWDILKGRFGKLVLVNLIMVVTILPLAAVIFMRYLEVGMNGLLGPYGAGLGVGYPVLPDLSGYAESAMFRTDLIWFGLMIPAAAIAALGISGGGYIIRNLIWTEGIFVANDFLRGIKRNYWNVLEAVLVLTVVLFMARTMGNLADMLIADASVSANASIVGWLTASKVVGYVLVAFALLVMLWMISLGISYKQGPWALFRNAVVMTVGTFPQTVFFAALATWPVFLTWFGGQFLAVIGILLLVIFAISYMLLVWLDYTQWAFDKFVNPNMGYATGRGLYDKNAPKKKTEHTDPTTESAAMREYRRQIVAMGKSKLVCRPIKPIDDDLEVYQLPESFSRDDLQRLKESKTAIEEDTKAYEEEHKDDERYVEYNRQFEERERALQEEDAGGKKKKKKAPKPPKMLNKR